MNVLRNTISTTMSPRRKNQPAARRATRTAGGVAWSTALTFAGLIAATLIAYQPAWHGTLLWDDAQHLTAPPLRSVSGLWHIWFSMGATQQFYPVVHTAFWLQHRLWGDATLGYHLANILLHATSAGLLALILRRLSAPGAVLAAFIFALHPVNVESVAWITELKNTMSTVFYLAAALAYLRFDETRVRRFYGLALGLFALALLSKSVTATLPAGLLVVLWWQRGSVDWRRDVVPLLPLFTLGVAGGLTTAWVEQHLIGARGSAFDFTLVERCLIAGHALWFYLGKILWPSNLIFIYPRWEVSQGVWWQYAYPIAMLAVLAAGWAFRTRSRAPLAALLFFGIALGPALGFVNVYPFKFSFVADHFQYLASVSVIALAAAVLTRLAQSAPWSAARRAAPAAVVAMLGVLTWQQSHEYASATTLYRATIARNPSAWLAHNNLATELMNGTLADVQEGVSHARIALRLEPDDVDARYNLAGGLKRLGDVEGALVQYQAVLAVLGSSPAEKPRMAALYRSLGNALNELGRQDEAIANYGESLRIAPDSAPTHTDLGVALSALGRHDEALAHFADAARLEPAAADRHTNLAGALLQMGRFDDAIAEYRAAVTLAPGAADVYNDLGVALLSAGRPAEAIVQFEAALRLEPGHGPARVNLVRAHGLVRGK
jgi:tetratricopeptide (TPR) repeat protein